MSLLATVDGLLSGQRVFSLFEYTPIYPTTAGYLYSFQLGALLISAEVSILALVFQ